MLFRKWRIDRLYKKYNACMNYLAKPECDRELLRGRLSIKTNQVIEKMQYYHDRILYLESKS